MKKELQEQLYNKYPKIFADKDKSMRESCMYWGIECPGAWYWLIDRLCGSIQGYIDNNSSETRIIPQVVASQVKEKFGGLRFYYAGGDDYINGMVWLAEDQSYSICAKCGSTENIVETKGWITYLCENCFKQGTK